MTLSNNQERAVSLRESARQVGRLKLRLIRTILGELKFWMKQTRPLPPRVSTYLQEHRQAWSMLFRHRRLVCRRNDEPRIVLPTGEWSQPGPQPHQEQETQDEQTGL